MLRAFGILFLLLLVLAAMGPPMPVMADADNFATVTPEFDYGSDAGMVLDGNNTFTEGENYTVEFILAMVAVIFVTSLFEYLRSRNFPAVYSGGVNKFVNNLPLTDALEKHYFSLPEEIRRTVDLPIDLIILVSKMTSTQADDILEQHFAKIRDGLPNEPETGKG